MLLRLLSDLDLDLDLGLNLDQLALTWLSSVSPTQQGPFYNSRGKKKVGIVDSWDAQHAVQRCDSAVPVEREKKRCQKAPKRCQVSGIRCTNAVLRLTRRTLQDVDCDKSKHGSSDNASHERK